MMKSRLQKIDWIIVIILFVFMFASTMIVRSAVMESTMFAGIHTRHMLNYGLGFIVLFGAAFINYRIFLKWAPYLYALGVTSLVAVYFLGITKNGARGWFSIPGLGLDIQPAEVMKLFIILLLAYYLAKRNGELLRLSDDVMPASVFVIVPFMLVLSQPDLGNAVIYMVILIGMLWNANIKYTHVFAGVGLATAIIAGGLYVVTVFHDPMDRFLSANGAGHWMDRIDAYLSPEQASSDQSYQLQNSMMAIGSGALLGEGYLQGSSVHSSRIPYTYSDSIFVVIAEEFGFIGSSTLLLLYFLLIYRLILISIQINEPGGSYIIAGMVSMFVFQIFQNIGMFLAILPLTGITLPFISYGGSSLLINMLSIGLALSIRVYAKEELIEDITK
jgi:rod shape determining protein RodA